MTNYRYNRSNLPAIDALPPGTMLITERRDKEYPPAGVRLHLGDVILCVETDGSQTLLEVVPSRGVDNSAARAYVFAQPLCLLWINGEIVKFLRESPEHIETIGQLVAKTKRGLLKIPGFKREYLDELTQALDVRSLRLGMKVPVAT